MVQECGLTQPVPQCPPASRITTQETCLVGITQRPSNWETAAWMRKEPICSNLGPVLGRGTWHAPAREPRPVTRGWDEPWDTPSPPWAAAAIPCRGRAGRFAPWQVRCEGPVAKLARAHAASNALALTRVPQAAVWGCLAPQQRGVPGHPACLREHEVCWGSGVCQRQGCWWSESTG